MQLIMGEASQKSDLLLAILTHAFCLLIGLAALSASAWVVTTGQLFTLDGLALVFASLAAATFFTAHTAWAAYTGELLELLGQLRPKSQAPAAELGSPSPPDQKQ
jgi:hypothetical protein